MLHTQGAGPPPFRGEGASDDSIGLASVTHVKSVPLDTHHGLKVPTLQSQMLSNYFSSENLLPGKSVFVYV